MASAKKYLGIPYVWGGTTTAGLDCSGLVQLALKDLGIDVPRVSRDQATVGTDVPSLTQAKPGDLIAFGSPVNHIAIYVGDNQILEAPQAGQDVHIGPIHRTPVAIRRVVPGGDGTPIDSVNATSGLTSPSDATGSLSAGAAATGTDALRSTSATGGADAISVSETWGIPPSLLARFDQSQLSSVPRAVPLSALGVTVANSDGGVVSIGDGMAAVARSFGLSAEQLTTAGLSSAVAAFADDFAAAERQYNLPSGILAAVAQAESGGRSDAVSSAGAQGLMQLMPGTAAALGVGDPFDPTQAIRGAAQYLSDNLAAFDGSVTKALAAYNAGPGAVRQYGGVPPYAETQNYVRQITDMLARLS